MRHPTQFILNPRDDHHRTGRLWQTCQRECLRSLRPADTVIVEDAAEAALAARQAAMNGYVRLIVVGGAATVNGVINGIMGLAPSHRQMIKLGILSISRTAEWSRTTGFPRALNRQLEVLQAAQSMPFDLGRVVTGSGNALSSPHYFLNGAGFGMVSEIHEALSQSDHSWPDALRQIAASVGNFVFNETSRVRIEGEGGILYQGSWVMGMVMIGKVYPGIGEVAPEADPRDGLLDLVWVEARSRRDKWRQLSNYVLRRGSRGLARARSSWIRCVSLNVPMHVETDGVTLERLPAEFSVEPRALSIIVSEALATHRTPRFAALSRLDARRLVGRTARISRAAS